MTAAYRDLPHRHLPYRDLRYVLLPTTDLAAADAFAGQVLGLMLESRTQRAVYFRSDARIHSLCFALDAVPSVGLTVGSPADLENAMQRLQRDGFQPVELSDEDAALRHAKAGISVAAPNGVRVDLLWRPLTSGWPFHGQRQTGITGLQSVQLASTQIDADEVFWTNTMGGQVSDWAGHAAFISLDGAHHRIALYPSARNGVLGVTFGVNDLDDVMRNWYFLQKREVPVAHGPGKQPTSGATFVSMQGPGGVLYSYATEMDAPLASGPRQFPDAALSHCAWGSHSTMAEFAGRAKK